MKRLDGSLVANFYLDKLKSKVQELEAKRGYPPCLCVVLASDDIASCSYVKAKQKACNNVGIKCIVENLGCFFSKKNLYDTIDKFNSDDLVDGIIVQLPIYGVDNPYGILDDIVSYKDVDGFNSINYGKMSRGVGEFIPATPKGILMLLEYYNINPTGLHTVIVGRGPTVGAPLSILLSLKQEMANSTVTLAHSYTKNLIDFTKQADILVAALGVPLFIDKTMIKTGAVIIDVGISKVKDASKKKGYRIVGDVDYDSVYDKCSFITPMPGGVGPMTITALLYNTLYAAEKKLL